MPLTFVTTDTNLHRQPPRKRWTRSEVAVLESSGLFESQRLELVEGELIDKMGKKRPHSNAVSLLMGWLVGAFGQAFVQQEIPIDVAPEDIPTSEPEPDLVVLTLPFLEFSTANPRPQELRLVVEVSDTTLSYDLGVKSQLYARAGIAEYWVVDLAGKKLIVHRVPDSGCYAEVKTYRTNESVCPLSAPNIELRVDSVIR